MVITKTHYKGVFEVEFQVSFDFVNMFLMFWFTRGRKETLTKI